MYVSDEVEDEHKLSILQEDPILNPLLDDLCQWLARTLQIIVTPDNFTGIFFLTLVEILWFNRSSINVMIWIRYPTF